MEPRNRELQRQFAKGQLNADAAAEAAYNNEIRVWGQKYEPLSPAQIRAGALVFPMQWAMTQKSVDMAERVMLLVSAYHADEETLSAMIPGHIVFYTMGMGDKRFESVISGAQNRGLVRAWPKRSVSGQGWRIVLNIGGWLASATDEHNVAALCRRRQAVMIEAGADHDR